MHRRLVSTARNQSTPIEIRRISGGLVAHSHLRIDSEAVPNVHIVIIELGRHGVKEQYCVSTK